jgi:tRNA-dihydrouridine synthase 3
MGGHTREDEKGELVLVVDEEKKARSVFTAMEVNYVGPGVLKQLRSKTVCSPASCDV